MLHVPAGGAETAPSVFSAGNTEVWVQSRQRGVSEGTLGLQTFLVAAASPLEPSESKGSSCGLPQLSIFNSTLKPASQPGKGTFECCQ